MRFQYQNQIFKIWFQYTITGRRRETLCLIDIEGDPHTFAYGSTRCSTKDRFEKAAGREVAFKRALQYAVKEKHAKNEFWKAASNCYKNRALVPKKEAA